MQSNAPKHFQWPVRVYYEDTDSAGVVYYANYLRYMERARTEWLRALGFEHADLEAQHGVGFVVRTVTIDYLQPARLDDALEVSVELLQLGASQIKLKQAVTRAGTLLCEASVRMACVCMTATATIKAVRIPRIIIESIQPA